MMVIILSKAAISVTTVFVLL